MATDREILKQIQQTNAERHLLHFQLEFERYKRLRRTSATRVQPKRKLKTHSPDKWKSKYIALLPHNIIIDFSNADQLKLIGIKLNQLNSRFQIENRVAGKTFLKNAESYRYTDSNERGTKIICVHI
ncbi:MAG: hypothetical protein EXX96DRAFT_483233 [Benjaminiella poitrasii]|nr:MAG: hypothetical protein EXX96DRAFT_483233 [Benjaminiella poitrasii]